MSEPYSHDRLIRQIICSTETLAACEQTARSAHAMLAKAQFQIERSHALHRQLDFLDQHSHTGPFWQEPQDPADKR